MKDAENSMIKKKKTLVLIDSNALIHRAFHALPPLTKKDEEFRQNWARLIQKVYEFDPLICPKCQGPMRIISFIEEIEIIEKPMS